MEAKSNLEFEAVSQSSPRVLTEVLPEITLEIGAGEIPIIYNISKRAEEFARDPNKKYIGIDLDRENLQLSRNEIKGLYPDPDKTMLAQARGDQLPFAAGSVGEVVLHNVLGDMRSPSPEILTEAARVLKDGGKLRIIEDYTPEVAREWLAKHGQILPSDLEPTMVLTSKDIHDHPEISDPDQYHLKEQGFLGERYRKTIWEFEKRSVADREDIA